MKNIIIILTALRAIVAVAILVIMFLLGIITLYHIEEHGLKDIIERIWEGSNQSPTPESKL